MVQMALYGRYIKIPVHQSVMPKGTFYVHRCVAKGHETLLSERSAWALYGCHVDYWHSWSPVDELYWLPLPYPPSTNYKFRGLTRRVYHDSVVCCFQHIIDHSFHSHIPHLMCLRRGRQFDVSTSFQGRESTLNRDTDVPAERENFSAQDTWFLVSLRPLPHPMSPLPSSSRSLLPPDILA